jgi:hypothetical protein
MRVCIREPLTADRTYYVRTDGNDNNTGLVNDAGGAFLTIQKAVNVVAGDLDLGLFNCTIQVGAGTYSETVVLKPYLGTTVPVLRGDNATPSNVAIAPATGHALVVTSPTRWTVEGVKLTSSDGRGLSCAGNAVVQFQDLEFGACGTYHVHAYLGGAVTVAGNYRISGGARIHLLADTSGASIRLGGWTITLTGTPNFSEQFAHASRAGAILAVDLTFSGSATGMRYLAVGNGAIETRGGPNYFPGNAAGNVDTGGIYY